ncbi:MAG: type I pullulanase [Oscillospiraceae bacterium]|nr:type I pullulanase [Oscillospiraceae bacterium]
MKKQISLLLALVMVLSLILVPGVFSLSVSAEESAYPVQVKVHYTRADGNYTDWDVYQWGGAEVTAFEVAADGSEAVATIFANPNTASIGFIVRYGGDSWTDREMVDDSTGDRMVEDVYAELPNVVSGTIHVYVDSANPSVTTLGECDVVTGVADAPEYDITIKVHYYREDGDYTDWEVHMWNGVESLNATRAFDEEDENGWKVATYYADASDTWAGFIVKKPDWTKDPDGDRKIDLSDVTGGTVHVYAVSGSALEDFETDKSQAVLGAKISSAVYNQDTGNLTVTVSYPMEEPATLDSFTLEGPDGEMGITAVEAVDEYNYTVSFEGTITDEEVYTMYFEGVSCTVTVPNIYSTEGFEAEYTYEGDDLGATWSAESTTFRVWAPTATKVAVKLYTTGSSNESGAALLDTYEMTPDVNGTWVVTVDGDLNGVYYIYAVTRSGATVEACDPYARTAGINGNRAMVIDLDSTDPEGWEKDTYVTVDNYTDAVIWETHVRDFSIAESSGMENKGKYLAFTEEGTTVNGEGEIATGVDYLAELGVNYVHLLPVYDINSVDEASGGYNWGYDPKNYNVPEGSYATNAYNGAVRVKEFKQMVQSLHANGIGVIMDVVYNHVADAGSFCFNQIVPGYFSRIQDDGSYQSNSGCGNDTATERSMVQKYIVDSVLYWAEEYHIDGFRWDLVGLIDYETINAAMEAVHAVNPNIVFYGEGWDMCTWTTKNGYTEKMTIQDNDAEVNTEAGVFAFFNDTIRNLMHGGVFTATDKGFTSGNLSESTVQSLIDSYMGNSTWGTNSTSVDTPLQTVNYASCHDNFTLFDNLTIDAMDATGLTAEEVREQAAAMNNLAAAYYLTAQGVPFMQAGEEMLRSKPDAESETGYNHNSYASGDEINAIKWDSLADALVSQTHDYYQGLLAFRSAHSALRMTSEEEVLSAMSAMETGSNDVVAFLNEGGNGEDAQIISIFNAGSENAVVSLPEGLWGVCVNKSTAGTGILYTVSGEVEIENLSAMILVSTDEAVAAPTEEADSSMTPVIIAVLSIAALAAVAFVLKKREH